MPGTDNPTIARMRYKDKWIGKLRAQRKRFLRRKRFLCALNLTLLTHCHQISRELRGIECAPARGHIIAIGDGIGAAIETDLVVVGWR